MEDQHNFLLAYTQALTKFGAPSHHIESQLSSVVERLEVKGTFIQLPGVIVCSFMDDDTDTSETHLVKSPSWIWLGNLQKTHETYRAVMHDEMSAADGAVVLQNILNNLPCYPNIVRYFPSFPLSFIICPLAFGGSFVDAWVSGFGALILISLQLFVVGHPVYSAIFEYVFYIHISAGANHLLHRISVGLAISFSACGLSSIPNNLFCYTAITSSSNIGILLGYLIYMIFILYWGTCGPTYSCASGLTLSVV